MKICNTLKNENGEQSHKICINVLQPSLTKPIYHLQDGTQSVMTPYIARMNKLTYASSLYVNVNVVIEATNKDGIIEKFNKTINGVYIGKIPVMVRSKACILQQMPALGEEGNNECRYDYGGYFIINGSEKVLISQDRINENKTLVFQPNNNNEGLYAEIRSMSDSSYLPPKTTSLNMSGKLNHMGRIIRLSTSFIKSEVPVFVMFRALGIISDKEIMQHIVYDLDNKDNQRIITELMACCEDACDVHTQEQAQNTLIRIMTGANKAPNAYELLRNNITNDFLPHVGKSYRRKALYLGYMIRKMIRIFLGYDTYDNRDSYMNKRIDTPGILMSNLFRQCYGKMTKEIKVLIEKELNLWRANQNSIATCDIISDNNIHRYFRQSLLESWLKYSLSTGNWGIKSIGSFQNIRQGVSQVLNRMSYASTLSHLRRINTAMEKNGKLVQPRKLDNSQIGMICPAECFDPNTPILLWNGTIKKAEDIVVGDYLIDDKGNSVRVKSTCSGYKRMYEVIQNKKNFMNYTVTDNHILTLKVKNHKNIRNHRGKKEFTWFNKKGLKFNYKDFNNIEDLNEFSSSKTPTALISEVIFEILLPDKRLVLPSSPFFVYTLFDIHKI
jgi:DNA-directed RNA polymerase II subunit RPB2